MKSSAQLDAEIAESLAGAGTKRGVAKSRLTADQFNVLAVRASETQRPADFEALLAAVRKLKANTPVGVRGNYGGVSKIAEAHFIQLTEEGPIVAPWSRRAIVEEIVPRRAPPPRRLDVSPTELRAVPKTRFLGKVR